MTLFLDQSHKYQCNTIILQFVVHTHKVHYTQYNSYTNCIRLVSIVHLLIDLRRIVFDDIQLQSHTFIHIKKFI